MTPDTCEDLEITLDNDVLLQTIEVYVETRISSSCSRGIFTDKISQCNDTQSFEEQVDIYKQALFEACLNDVVLDAIVSASEAVLANAAPIAEEGC